MSSRSPMLLLIDNYDSFVHNLARYLRRLGQETLVLRNDAVDAARVLELAPLAIVLSPGPCTPREAGNSLELVEELQQTIPMLGVCLGHQIIAEALGGRIERAPEPMHGRTSLIEHEGRGLFHQLDQPLQVCRYHSLVVNESSLPADVRVTARTNDGVVMAFRHQQWPLFGVQFHPESVLTRQGFRLLTNFLNLVSADQLPDAGALPDESRPIPRSSALSPTPSQPLTF